MSSELNLDTADRWPQSDRRRGADRRTGAARHANGAGQPNNAIPAPGEERQGDRRTGEDRRVANGWQPVELDAYGGVDASEQDLLRAAVAARELAHAHYSNFKVGAALETVDRTVITGCNIENASYGLTICAERVALVKALSEGHTAFTRIVVVADTEAPTPPCGPCRQLLWEYCGDIEVLLGNRRAVTAQYRLSALLPLPFEGRPP